MNGPIIYNRTTGDRVGTSGFEMSDKTPTTHESGDSVRNKKTLHYRDLFDSVPLGLYHSTPDGRILDANPQLVDLLGYTDKESLIAANAADFYVDPQARDLWQSLMKREGVVRGFEAQMRRHDGRLIWVRNTARTVRDVDGKVLYYEGSLEDITERKRMEMVLRESEEKYRTLIDNMQDGVFVIRDDKLVFVNEAFARMVGWTVEEIIGTSFQQHVAPEDLEMVAGRYRQRQAGEEVPSEYEFRAVHKDGVTRVFVNMSVGLVTYQGATASMGTVKDITGRNRMEEQLRESEERYRTLYESSRDAIVATDLNGQVVECNQAYEDMLGYSPEELRGIRYQDITPPKWHTLDVEVSKQVMTLGYSDEFEKEFIRRDGSVIPVSMRVWRIDDKAGGSIGTWTMIRNITERKRAERALREERDKAQMYLDVARVMIVALDTDGRVSLMNRKGCEILGYEGEEVVGKDWFDNFLPERVKDDVRGVFARMMNGEIEHIEYRERSVLTKSGEERTIAWHTNRLMDEAGNIDGVLSSGEDVTERKRASEALRAASEISSLYLDLMAHDITNQLQVISGNAAILQNEIRVPETMRKLNGIMHSVDKCATVISKVKLTEQLMTVPLGQRRLDEVLMGCVSMLSKLNDDATVETDIQIAGALVLADRFLEELLMNLLKNAVEHNPRENRHVWVRLTEEVGGYGVSIADNGEGITDPRKVQLFDMTRRYGGVGLHLCKHILDKYGGRIEVSDREPSDPSQGLEVTVWLPGIE